MTILIFDKNILLLTKIFDFWPQFLIFDQKFYFSTKLWFYTKFLIFEQNFGFRPNFWFLTKIFDEHFSFWTKVWFQTKFFIINQNWFLTQKNFLVNILIFSRFLLNILFFNKSFSPCYRISCASWWSKIYTKQVNPWPLSCTAKKNKLKKRRPC